jgi:hypothetical protein
LHLSHETLFLESIDYSFIHPDLLFHNNDSEWKKKTIRENILFFVFKEEDIIKLYTFKGCINSAVLPKWIVP